MYVPLAPCGFRFSPLTLFPDICEGFPQVINSIVDGTSDLIRCTFNPGPQVWDAEAEFHKLRPRFTHCVLSDDFLSIS